MRLLISPNMTLLRVGISYLVGPVLRHRLLPWNNRVMEGMRVSIVRGWVIFICRSSINKLTVENVNRHVPRTTLTIRFSSNLDQKASRHLKRVLNQNFEQTPSETGILMVPVKELGERSTNLGEDFRGF
jgi:hypothetical protein